jgi:hypothetical protein
MIEKVRRTGWARVCAIRLAMAVAAPFSAPAADNAKAPGLWFDPTQLPSFTGAVDRFVPNPDGQIDRLIFKEGAQIVFPPDALEAIRTVAAPGKTLVVWGVRARSAPVITMLAFAAPDAEPTLLDRFYWRPERNRKQGRRHMILIGKVKAPYLSPQGQIAGAILESGDVIRVDRAVADALKDRLAPGANIVAEGTGVETSSGKAIDAVRVGEAVATLEGLPAAKLPAQPGLPAQPRRGQTRGAETGAGRPPR